jgi:hypothetical protein
MAAKDSSNDEGEASSSKLMMKGSGVENQGRSGEWRVGGEEGFLAALGMTACERRNDGKGK